MAKPIFIAEIKTQSMFGFEAVYHREHLTEYAIRYGDWISVHTDARFGGSFDDIYRIRRMTDKPILAKGFHTHIDDVKKAFDLGADYVLSVDSYHPDCRLKNMLYEITQYPDIPQNPKHRIHWENMADHPDLQVVYNGRNLNSGIGRKYIGNYSKYRAAFKWVCGASLLQHPRDVQMFYPGCDAFIVGENLIEFITGMKDTP